MSVKKRKLYKKLDRNIEKVYSYFGSYPDSIRNDLGIKQFCEHEYLNILPKNPDLYYLHLKTGKVLYNLSVETYRKAWGTNNWDGWYHIREDFKDNLWLIKYLFNWIKYPEELDNDKGFCCNNL